MQHAGFISRDVPGIEPADREETDYIYSTKVGTVWGFVAGLVVGILQLITIGPAAVANWGRIIAILVSCGLGWAMYGAIAGGSGVFTRRR